MNCRQLVLHALGLEVRRRAPSVSGRPAADRAVTCSVTGEPRRATAAENGAFEVSTRVPVVLHESLPRPEGTNGPLDRWTLARVFDRPVNPRTGPTRDSVSGAFHSGLSGRATQKGSWNRPPEKTLGRVGIAAAGLLVALGPCLGAQAQGSPTASPQAPVRGPNGVTSFGPGERPDQHDELDRSQRASSLRPIASLPFELSRNRILLRDVSLGGPEKLIFVFDSGAGSSGLDAAAWDRIGLRGDDQVVASGAGGTMTTEVKRNATLAVGPVTLGPITLMKGLTRPTVSETGESSSGTIGVDLLRRYVVTVDFVERRLDIYDPATYSNDGSGDALDIIFWNDIVHVAGAFTTPAGEAVRGEFALDLGNPGGLTLEPSVIAKHALLAAKEELAPLTLRGAAGGTVRGFRTVYPSLTLGTSVLPRIPVVLLETPLMGRTLPWSGFIGLEVLRRFHVTFDYEHKKLYLAKNRWFDDPLREAVTASAGVAPAAEAAPASWSAAEAAVRAGDAARLR